MVLEVLVDRAARLPVVEEDAEEEERGEAGRRRGRPFAADRDARAAEEVERRLAADHREDDVVGQGRFAAIRSGEHDVPGLDPRDPRREPHPQRAGPVRGRGVEERARGGRLLIGARLLDRDARRRVVFEHPELLDVLRLRASEVLAAVTERDVRARRDERDRRLERGVAAADDEGPLAGVVLRVVEAVEDLVGAVLAGHAEPPVIAAPADRDERRAARGRPARRRRDGARASPSRRSTRSMRAGVISMPRVAHAPDHAVEERLLRVDLGAKLQVAARGHAGRVGVDRLCLREIRRPSRRARRSRRREAQSGRLRLDGRRDAGHAGADDGEVEDVRIGAGPALAREIRLREDRLAPRAPPCRRRT